MKGKSLFSLVMILVVAGLVAFGGYTFFKDLEGPTFALIPESDHVSPQRELMLTMQDPSGIRSVTISVRKNNSTVPIFEKTFKEPKKEESVTFSLKNSGLRDGAFDLEIKVVDASLAGFGQGNARTRLLPMSYDTKAPNIALENARPPYIRRGGSAVICYKVSEGVSRTGVRLGELFFRAFQQKDGSYVCFFPFPHYYTVQNYHPTILAEDLGGNVKDVHLPMYPIDRTFKQDTMPITDAFLEKVNDTLQELAPNAKTPLERYMLINKNLRAANVQFLRELGSQSANSMLWRGAFMRLPRSAPRAGFADHRIYMYNNEKIDEQDHLGFDLASVQNADVPAANNGRIVYTGALGIYGNLIVIDHGLGVMSLYSHLSSITVNDGDEVTRGQIIGKTGSTGMAFGDHLHFGILVGGIEVTPLEWIDPQWIRDNITSRLTPQS
ncbi:MAG: M23 family metallopeptidase [Desulfovibrionaceae bacterium]|nr:M23 family metallopeptidase [Desulfovibrionaceae bacterium]